MPMVSFNASNFISFTYWNSCMSFIWMNKLQFLRFLACSILLKYCLNWLLITFFCTRSHPFPHFAMVSRKKPETLRWLWFRGNMSIIHICLTFQVEIIYLSGKRHSCTYFYRKCHLLYVKLRPDHTCQVGHMYSICCTLV